MKRFFETNTHKASARVTINSFMIGSLFFILTLVWSLNPSKFSIYLVAQIVFAIPLLFVSSLAYAKIGYWQDIKMWDAFGWFTNNIGSIFILNVVGLMTVTVNRNLAALYFLLIIILMAIYSVINVVYKPATLKEKLFKFSFFLLILISGGILPAFL